MWGKYEQEEQGTQKKAGRNMKKNKRLSQIQLKPK